jgi:tape measure domain-containing protein
VEAASVEVVFKANLDNLRKSIAQAEKQLVDFNKRAAALANIGARGGSSLLPGGRNSVSDALAQKQMANATTATNAYVRATNNLSASVGRLNGALGPLQTQLAKIGTSTASVNTATNAMSRTYSRVPAQVNQTRASFVSLSGALQGVAAAYASFQGLQGFKSLLDTSNRINNSLRVIGHEGQDLIDTYNTLFESAQRNFTSVEALTTLYSRLGLAQNELGKNSQEIMDFTDRVALALRVQGTSAQEARGALIQLTQAMGSGIVRAEEFNSIVEGAPSILRATARGLEEAGGSVAKLRTIVIDGELSSRAFFEAFMLGSEGLADLVEDNVVTIDQAYSRFYNSLINTASEIDSSVGVTESLTSAISQLADELTGLGNWFTDNTSEIRAFFEEMDKLGKLLNDVNKAAYDLGYTIGNDLGIHDAVRGVGAAFERSLNPAEAAIDELQDRAGEARRELIAFAESLALNSDSIDPLIVQKFQEIIDKLTTGKISAEEAKVAIDNLSGISPDFSFAIMGIQGMITNFGNLVSAALAARAAISSIDTIGTAPRYSDLLGTFGLTPPSNTTSIKDNPVLNKPSSGGGRKGGGGKTPAQSLQEEIEKIREKIALNQIEIDLMGKSAAELDTARTRLDLINRAKQLGITLTEDQLSEINAVSAAYGQSQQELENMNKAIEQQEALVSEFASIVGELFSKPIKDADDFFDTVFSGFARLGQANLQNSLEGLFSGTLFGGGEAAVDPTTKIANAVQKGAQKGTETGTSTGLGDFFGGLFGGGEGGQSGIASVLSAGAGGLGIGYQTQDPIMGALGGALSGISGGPVGIAVGALGGLIGGLFGMNKALQEAQEKLAKVRGEIDSFVDVGEGRGLGQLTQALRDYYDKSYEYQELAMKAGDGALQKRLQEAANSFFFFIEKDFKLGFEGTIESLSSGQGLSGAFVSAQQSIIGLREELKGFIADTDYIGNKALNVEDDPATAERVRRAQEAAQQFVLSILSGAEELTEFEKATEEANGKASALQVTLEQLGMASEDAARAIEQALGMAIAKLRDEYATDINNSINELSGFGFINEIVEAQVKYQERLRDAQALGLDGASALQELNLSLASVARSAGLTQTQIDILAKTFPQMAGLIELLAGEDTQQNLAKAQAQLRSAYDAQARSLETTIGNLNRFVTSLQKFRENLRLDGALSPLTPLQRLQEAQMQFQQTMAAALTGDEEALGRVEDVSRQYLEEARAYYGTSANYFAIFEEVEALLGNVENVAKNQLTETQKELTLLQEQVGKLIDIDNSVMSVADAIAALQLAQAASDAALAAQLAALAMTNQNAIAQIYQNVLGRDPDAGGLAYYQNQMNQGKTSGQIEDTIRKSNEYRLQQLYQSILGRRGDAEGLAYWSRELDRGVTIEQIAEEFMRNKSIGQFATGGFHGGGLRIVGENGPELEMTGPSRIWSAQQTSNFVSAANNNSSAETLRELQALRQEVSQLRAGQNQGNQIAASGFSATVNATQENTQVAKQQATNNWQNNYRRFA